ncbi:MAG TPA: SRPBCC family protein [Solirubrobacteraceae bacterium]|nr:SRPBCC family protein [Solirubrobacteraceae bacterium]
MPTARRTRTIAASRQELWEVLGDPHHLPRWWPRVNRVEAVTLAGTPHSGGGAGEFDAFTEVLMSGKGKMVRADFKRLQSTSGQRIVWAQQVENTPFARILASAETEINLSDGGVADDGPATEVTIELRQTMHGFLARLGSHLVRRAAHSTLDEALDGLERIVGRSI